MEMMPGAFMRVHAVTATFAQTSRLVGCRWSSTCCRPPLLLLLPAFEALGVVFNAFLETDINVMRFMNTGWDVAAAADVFGGYVDSCGTNKRSVPAAHV